MVLEFKCMWVVTGAVNENDKFVLFMEEFPAVSGIVKVVNVVPVTDDFARFVVEPDVNIAVNQDLLATDPIGDVGLIATRATVVVCTGSVNCKLLVAVASTEVGTAVVENSAFDQTVNNHQII